MGYRLIYNEEKLLQFLNRVLYNSSYGQCPNNLENSVFCLAIVARTKYLGKESDVDIKSNLQFYKAVIRSKDRLVRKIKQVNLDYVVDRNDTPIPPECMAVYVTLSPRDPLRAVKFMVSELTELMYKTCIAYRACFESEELFETKRLDVLAFTAYHKHKIKTQRVVIDVDARGEKSTALEFITRKVMPVCTYGVHTIVETHSGYHVYVDLCKLDKHAKAYLFQELSKIEHPGITEVNVNTDPMVVLPGTLQGGFPVKEIEIPE